MYSTSLHPQGSRTRGNDIELGVNETSVTERVRDLRGDLIAAVAIDQSDGATAEAATSHPRAKSTGSTGRVDSGVQFRAGDLVAVTQGVVGGIQERPHLANPAGIKELNELRNAVVLSNDVTNAVSHLFVVKGGHGGSQVTDITQAANSEDACGILAGSPSRLVLAVDQPVRGAGIDDKQFQIGSVQVEGDLTDRPVVTVDEEGVTFDSA